MLSKLALGRPVITVTFVKTAIKENIEFKPCFRKYSQRVGRDAFTRSRERMTLKERAMQPPGPNAYSIGKGALAGASGIGLGALCYYGIGLGKGVSAYDNSMFWPQYVKDRIKSTYGYFGGSILITAASAYAVFQNQTLLNLVSRNGLLSIMGIFALMIGSGMATQAIPYESGFCVKQLVWATHCGIMGAVIAPICFLGGPIIIKAAWYTAGVIGGLSALAVSSPNDKFLYMGGPLGIGLGLVFASSLANMWLPPTTALGAGLYSLSLYGGLIVFSGFLLFDTQRIIKIAEMYPQHAPALYDPINMSLSIYMDTLNIFIRIASILAGNGGNTRRK